METNRIIEELRAKAAFDWQPEQKAWFEQQANDARQTGISVSSVINCCKGRRKDVFGYSFVYAN